MRRRAQRALVKEDVRGIGRGWDDMRQIGCNIVYFLFIVYFVFMSLVGFHAIADGNWSRAIIAFLLSPFPFIVLLYLAVRRGQLRQQATTQPGQEEAQPEDTSVPAHPLNTSAESVSPADIPDEIRRLAELRDEGVITNEEFERKKAELLDRM